MTTWDGPTFERLEAKRKRLEDEGKFGDFSSGLGLRPRRCTSWLERAEKEMWKGCPDYDAAFIFYWIAFNAAYAQGGAEVFVTRGGRGERDERDTYLAKIIKLDVGERIHGVIRMRFWGFVDEFLKNQYVYQPFWNHHNSQSGYEDWKSQLEDDRERVDKALKQWCPRVILPILFDRLYVLRNQLLHGGATWQGSINRRQVEDGAMMMALLVPLFIELMMDHPDNDWGAAYYPYVEESDGPRERAVTRGA